jgi:hypothetical protein
MLMTRVSDCRTMLVGRTRRPTSDRSTVMTVLYYRGIPADVWRSALATKRGASSATAANYGRGLGEVAAAVAAQLARAA